MKKVGYNINALYDDVLNPHTAQPETATPDDLPSNNDGEKYRQKIPSKNDGKIYRQDLPSNSDGNDGAGRVHRIEPKRKRVELRLDEPLYDLLNKEAENADVTINKAATQIFNLYFGRE